MENKKPKQKSPVKLFPDEKDHKHKEDSKSKDRSETRLRSRSRSQDSEEGDSRGEKKEQVEDVRKKISVPVTKSRDRRSRSQDSQGDKSLLDDSTVEEENLPDTQELSPEQRKRHLERARENLRKIKKMPITSRIVMHGRNNVS